MQDFSDIYSANKIRSDQKYVDRARMSFDLEGGQNARAFEQFFVAGLQQGRWLGNISQTGDQADFTTVTHETTPYDDIYHKIDVFTTLHFQEPVETFAGNIDKLPLAFDVTIQDKREAIVDKLTRCSNAPTPLPFGFSELTYYSDGRQKSSFNLLPRYVIGVNGNEAKDIREATHVDPNTGVTNINPLSARSLITRFKILTEIRAQNELYQVMLPEGADESDDVQLRQAAAYIEAADDCLRQALRICSEQIIQQECLPRNILEKIKNRPAKASPQPIIEEYLMQSAHESYIDSSHAYYRRNGGYFDASSGNDDTFVLIVNCARQLRDAAMRDEPDGPYLSQGAIKAHTEPFDIPKE